MDINWIKVSEIVFQALLTAVISAGLVYLAFRLGQRQARGEQKEREENELNFRRVDALTELIKSMQDFRRFFIIEYDPAGELSEADLSDGFHVAGVRLTREIERVLPLFPSDHDTATNQVLNKLIEEKRRLALEYLEAQEEGYKIPDYIENTFMLLIETIKYLQIKIEIIVKEFG